MADSSKEHVDKDAATAYEYLCRFEEAKKWIEAILMETLPPPMELENSLPNGVLLCALGKKLLPNDPMWKKVYDLDQARFKAKGLDYWHTDNVNFWLAALSKLGLPRFFLPSVEDIYYKKNFPRLIYSIHALSYFLKKQNMIGFSIEDLTKGKPTFSSDELSHTSMNLSKIDTLPSFNSLGALVDEELHYKALGLVESMQGDDKPETGGSQEPLADFDDPKYIPLSSTLIKEMLTSESRLTPVLCLACKTAGVRVSLYARKYLEKHKNGLSKDVEHALEKVNEALDKGDVQGAFEGLESKALGLPFVFKDPHTYFIALMEERKSGIPDNALCVYSGVSREACESILGVQGFGAYLIRDCKTEAGTFLFSFRNQSGVKHWRIMSEGDGYYLWGGARYMFDEFLEKFLGSLSNAAKVYTFQAVSASLRMVFDVEDEKTVKILEGLRYDRRLTYGQLFSVVRTVNSDIRHSRKVPAAVEFAPAQPKYPSWDHSKVVAMSRNDADNALNREGVPGSFLLRTSDTTPGDFALAFRTAKEIRHWKIACKGQKYFVHPRPNPYNSLEDIVAHFQEAVGQETKLLMIPLELKTDKTPEKPAERPNAHIPERAPDRVPEVADRASEKAQERVSEGRVPERRERTLERPEVLRLSQNHSHSALTPAIGPMATLTVTSTIGPTASLSKLNPANLTSWTVDDVCQWLLEQDFGQYIEIFRYNAIDGECMLTLDHELLKTDLGITALGHRTRILKRLNELKAHGR